MEFNNFKSYSIAGDNFIHGMMQTERKWQIGRDKFTSFIKTNGFSAWHIHNGWVRYLHNSGVDVLLNECINISWISSQAGYEHTPKCPSVGEKMIVVKNSPKGDEEKPFDLFCYDVLGEETNNYSDTIEIEVKLIEIKKVIFDEENDTYKFYVSKFDRLINKIKWW